MTHQEAIHIIKSRFEKIQACFEAVNTYFDVEEIHAFRKEVKKLRGFLHLVGGGTKMKLPGSLQEFYHIVGEIRNLQLQQQRIRQTFPHQSRLPETYLTLLTIEIAAAIRCARKLAAKRLLTTEEENQFVTASRRIRTRDVSIVFARRTISRLETLIDNNAGINDEALHSIRKCLKDLFYDFPYIEEEALPILPARLSYGKESVSTLTDLLGQFLDLRSGLILLQPHYIAQVTDAGEKKMLEKIRGAWKKEKEVIKNKILAALQAILHPTECAV